jgi:CMP-N-acetylneuraminic acid synthetase
VRASLLIGKDHSIGMPGKNVRHLLGRPMAEYGFMAAHAAGVDRHYVSTDSAEIAAIGKRYGAHHIARPADLATPDSLTEAVLEHAFAEMEREAGQQIDTVVLVFANAPAIDVDLIREGIAKIEADDTFDSAFSVVNYNMFSPARARRIQDDGSIEPFVDLSLMDNVSSIRDSQGDTYFCDLSVQVLKRRCFTHMDEGMQPFKWMGRKAYALRNDYGFDADAEWQVLVLEHWLRERGFSDADAAQAVPA